MLTPLESCKPKLYEYLLRANDTMFFAKFTLFTADADAGAQEWIALTSECPADAFNAARFA